jgi:peptide/nickel transport system substrate-binding protein
MKKLTTLLCLLATSTTVLAAPFAMPSKWSANETSLAKRGGSIKAHISYEPRTWNPFVADDHANLLNGDVLFTKDPITDDNLPYMAEKFVVSRDKKTWTITIRPELKWSNGLPVTAFDFETSMKILTDPKGEALYKDFYNIEGKPLVIKALTDTSFAVSLPSVSAVTFELLKNMPLAPHAVFGEAYKTKGWSGVKELWNLGTPADEVHSLGAFKLKEYKPGERVSLERNVFFGQWVVDSAKSPLPYLAEYTHQIIRNRAAALAQFLTGGLDVFRPSDAGELSAIKQSKRILKANVGGGRYALFLNFNWKNSQYGALFQQSEFRKAIAQLIDRNAIKTLVYDGLASENNTGVYGKDNFWVNQKVLSYGYNPRAAFERLAKLGVVSNNKTILYKGKALELTLLFDAGDPEQVQVSQIIKDVAGMNGIKIVPQGMDINALYGKLDAGDFELTLEYWEGGYNAFPIIPALQCDSGFRYHNPSCTQPWEKQWDTRYKRGLSELNFKARQQIAFDLQALEARFLPYVYLPTANSHFAWNETIRGYYPENIISAQGWSRRELLWKMP